jgi:hypothetical protein
MTAYRREARLTPGQLVDWMTVEHGLCDLCWRQQLLDLLRKRAEVYFLLQACSGASHSVKVVEGSHTNSICCIVTGVLTDTVGRIATLSFQIDVIDKIDCMGLLHTLSLNLMITAIVGGSAASSLLGGFANTILRNT